MSAIDPAVEKSRAAARAALVVLLPFSWCVYALKIPAASGTAALREALKKKGPAPAPAPSSTAVSWAKGGAPLTPADLAALSPAQALERARAISEQVNAGAADDGPAADAAQALDLLRSSNAEAREEGAMLLVDNRRAKAERAAEAIPLLEAMVRNGEQGAGVAELALKRIRFWAAKRGAP